MTSMLARSMRSFIPAALAVLGTACSSSDGPTENNSPQPVNVRFAARVGTAPFVCGQNFTAMGTSSSTATPTEFMMYVHDVRLLKADGTETPVTLTADNKWQVDNVALLDFTAGGPGTACASASADVNTQVVGTAPAGTYTGVRFVLGLPFAKNHSDQSTATGPLASSRLFWSWNAGYMAMRLDMNTTGKPGGWYMHVGSTGCTPSTNATTVPTSCAQPNRGTITLTGFNPTNNVIVADLKALTATTNLDVDLGGMPGCMSGTTDPECAALFTAVGLAFNGGTAPATSAFFRVGTP